MDFQRAGSVQHQDAQTFFEETPLPTGRPSIHQGILTAPTPDDTAGDASYDFLAQLDLAMMPSDRQEFYGYTFPLHRVYLSSSGDSHVQRVAVLHLRRVQVRQRCNDIMILLVHEDKWFGGKQNPHAQLVAKAIDTFQDSNARRLSGGLDPLDSKVIPGVIMVGTSPSFFKISVTRKLTRCIEFGRSPHTPIIVTGHVPVIPRPNRRFSEGMKPLDNRRAILQCYEAFKKFVV
ncbi:hypothetical protein IW262DRAFT_1448227 [Armillaria fumosa]|nr:hypothetical protein IW262DRAFT_1448227 [Armillaria fumosa]